MNRLLFVLLTLMTVNIPMAQAQYASRNQQGRSGVQLKSTPFKAFDWNLKSLNVQRGENVYFWDFEDASQMDDWMALDLDEDGYGWNYHYNDQNYFILSTHSGEGSIYSASYDNDLGQALTPDNWLISPSVQLGGMLTFWACAQDPYYPDEIFSVYVCTGDPNDINDFQPLTDDIVATSTMKQYNFDLSAYAGQEGCIAIRHCNCTDMFMLIVDDIGLTLPKTPVPIITCEETDDGMLILATGEGYISLYCDDVLVDESVGSASLFIPYGNSDVEYVIGATAQVDGYEVSDYAVMNVIVPGMLIEPIETPAPEINYELTDESLVITATGEGTVTLYVQFIDNMTGQMTTESISGDGDVVFVIPRGEEDAYVNVWAVAQAYGDAIPGVTEVNYFVEVPAMEIPLEITESPVITVEETADGVLVIATGEGHICLYCDGDLVAEGEGYASYFIPYGYDFMGYDIIATAQAEGKGISDPVLFVVEVPGLPIAPSPIFMLEEGDEFYTIYALSDIEGVVYLYCDGLQVDNPFIIERTDEDQAFTFEAYVEAEGYMPSEYVIFEVIVPAKAQNITGDLNGDGKVSITDVTSLIDYLLTHDSGDMNPVADVNHDGKVTVADVTDMINYLLNGTW